MKKTSAVKPEQNLKKALLIYSIAAAVVFFISMAGFTGAKLSAPLDDAFIYFQYAKNLAKFHFFEYVPGEGYSSGATSFLYAFILTPFALLFKGGSIIIITYFIGAACLFLSGYFIYRFILKLGQPVIFGVFGAALFVSNGNILWGYFSGMEIGIFSTLIIISLYYLTEKNKLKEQVLSLSLLSLIRPEGYILVIMFVFLRLVSRIFNKKEVFLPFLIPLAAGFIYFLVNYIFTGDFMPNTMRAKSDFSQQFFYYSEVFKFRFEMYLDLFIKIFNGGSEHYFLRYSFFFFLAGILPGAAFELKERKPGVFMVSFFWFFAGVMSTVFSSFFTVHNYRYSMPFVIVFVPFTAVGLSFIAEKLSIKDIRLKNTVIAAALSIFLAFNAFTIAANIINFGKDCRDIDSQSISAGKWIKENIEQGKTVAINDVGAITYYSDAKILDLVGLGTNGMARHFRNGIGCTFEELEHRRPDYFMVHLGWFNYERFSFFGLTDKRLVDFIIKKEPAYFVVGSPEVCVKNKMELYDSGNTMKGAHGQKSGMKVIDRIDVLDLRSEDAHNYSIFTRLIPDVPGTMMYEEPHAGTGVMIIDAGRQTNGGEEFTINGLVPGRDMKIVRRSYGAGKAKIMVSVDGQKADTWISQGAEGYHEEADLIPGEYIKNESVRIRLEEISGRNYNAFHYWVIQ